MTDKSKQIIKDESVKFPKDIQDAINAFNWGDISEEIGKKYLLSESEINNLQVEIGLILIGFENPELLVSNVEDEVGTTHDEAVKISQEVTDKIFTPIADKIEESIKEKIKGQKLNWKQSVNFILSGGDYSVFAEERENENSNPPNLPLSVETNSLSPRPDKGGVGEGLLGTTRRIQDIKSKFTI